MFTKEFDEISLADLQSLVDEGIPEGRQLEFKRDFYGTNDESRREFAADVSAMANAFGGYLLIGIDEKNGVASNICGVKAQDPDGHMDGSINAAFAGFDARISPAGSSSMLLLLLKTSGVGRQSGASSNPAMPSLRFRG
jgi:hypothetical protein